MNLFECYKFPRCLNISPYLEKSYLQDSTIFCDVHCNPIHFSRALRILLVRVIVHETLGYFTKICDILREIYYVLQSLIIPWKASNFSCGILGSSTKYNWSHRSLRKKNLTTFYVNDAVQNPVKRYKLPKYF